MACLKPLKAWRNENGSKLSFNSFSPDNYGGEILVPCGRCIGCRLEKSRQWAIRMTHEASLSPDNMFLTLTIDDAHMPDDYSLHLEPLQKFLKRYRKNHGQIRFFLCGEYGSKYGRPHYHLAIFGHTFGDLRLYKALHGGHKLYTSQSLQSLWPYGHSSVAALTFESAAYIARYCTKKINGDLSKTHYPWIDTLTGEVHDRKPEFATMSRNPGLAAGWYHKFGSDVQRTDTVIIRGRTMMPPRYYDYLYDNEDHHAALNNKYLREEKRFSLKPVSQGELDQTLTCLNQKNTLLIRKLESEL